MTDLVPPEVSDHAISGNEITVLAVVLNQMTVMESRILKQLNDQSISAKARWQSHDEQHDVWEKELRAIRTDLNLHLRKEEDEDLVFETRVRPVKTVASTIKKEWRTLTIIVLILIDFLSRALETMEHFVAVR